MKTFYVLFDGSHYLCDGGPPHSYSERLGEAMRFESLSQALDMNQEFDLQLEVLRVDITSAYTPNLLTENLPGCTDN